MEARKVLLLTRKWFWLIVLAVLIGGMAGLAVSLLQPKVYESDTTLYLNSPGRSDNEAVLGDEEAAKAFSQIPQSNSVLIAVLRKVGDKSLGLIQLSSMVTVANSPGTQYVTIGVRDRDPERAVRLATAIASQSITQFETAATGGDQTRQFVQQQMNSLANEIKNLENQLAAAQRRASLATSTPSTSNTPIPTQTSLTDQLNARLNDDRTLYNQLLNSYTSMSSIQVTVVQPAVVPLNPVGLGKWLAIALGALVGLIVIVGVIVLVEQTDDIVRTPEKISQASGLTTLMTIAFLPAIAKHFPQLSMHDEVAENGYRDFIENEETVELRPAVVKQARLLARRSESIDNPLQGEVDLVQMPETFWVEGQHDITDETIKRLPAITGQHLAARVDFKVKNKTLNNYQLPEEFLTLGILLSDQSDQFTVNGSKVKSLLVTSPENGDGKTSIASQLALGLARIGTQVVFVDANMRRPEVHNIFNLSKRVGLSNRAGLSTILLGNVRVETPSLFDALQKTDEPNLMILPSGPVVDSPAALLSSLRMSAVLNLLSERAFVVVDSSAVLTSSDAVILAKKCDSILMVADARHTAASKLNRALEILTRVNMNIVGVVLNRADN